MLKTNMRSIEEFYQKYLYRGILLIPLVSCMYSQQNVECEPTKKPKDNYKYVRYF